MVDGGGGGGGEVRLELMTVYVTTRSEITDGNVRVLLLTMFNDAPHMTERGEGASLFP